MPLEYYIPSTDGCFLLPIWSALHSNLIVTTPEAKPLNYSHLFKRKCHKLLVCCVSALLLVCCHCYQASHSIKTKVKVQCINLKQTYETHAIKAILIVHLKTSTQFIAISNSLCYRLCPLRLNIWKDKNIQHRALTFAYIAKRKEKKPRELIKGWWMWK